MEPDLSSILILILYSQLLCGSQGNTLGLFGFSFGLHPLVGVGL